MPGVDRGEGEFKTHLAKGETEALKVEVLCPRDHTTYTRLSPVNSV